MLTLFLYHVTVGRGKPLEEQLTRTVAVTLDTVIDAGGVEVKTGDSRKDKTVVMPVAFVLDLAICCAYVFHTSSVSAFFKTQTGL